MWIGIFLGVSALAIVSGVYLVRRALLCSFCQRLYEKNRALGILSAFWPIALCLPFLLVGAVAFVIVFLHLVLFWLLTDAVAWAIRRLTKKETAKRYRNGVIALSLTVLYLTYGWGMAHTVLQTNYQITTNKPLEGDKLRVVALADLHAGMTLKGEALVAECEKINALSPDLVLICGDFVDDATSREEMEQACDAMGLLKATHGVYFVFGNHDRGYRSPKAFTTEELCARLEENGVQILADQAVAVNETLTIVGREDASRKGRVSAAEWMERVNGDSFVIMMDHQPTDYTAIAAASPDLVISGHTHGGHIFPAGQIGMLMGANDMLYGMKTERNTTFVVTSGISGWEIPFKTLTRSEFVVIDVQGGA
ncbi:MAG: metallophosphoesterase [Ruminococcaceae bacterium]|nr:metallophosphoesterase [Oscillospiraceae bacterium]